MCKKCQKVNILTIVESETRSLVVPGGRERKKGDENGMRVLAKQYPKTDFSHKKVCRWREEKWQRNGRTTYGDKIQYSLTPCLEEKSSESLRENVNPLSISPLRLMGLYEIQIKG